MTTASEARAALEKIESSIEFCPCPATRRKLSDASMVFLALIEERESEESRDPRILRCAFCDAEYPPDTPATQHESLTAHIMECPKHPMRKLIEERERAVHVNASLRDGVWFASNRIEAGGDPALLIPPEPPDA